MESWRDKASPGIDVLVQPGDRCEMIYHLPPTGTKPYTHIYMYVMLKIVKSTSPWYHNPHSDHWCSCQHSSQASAAINQH